MPDRVHIMLIHKILIVIKFKTSVFNNAHEIGEIDRQYRLFDISKSFQCLPMCDWSLCHSLWVYLSLINQQNVNGAALES